MDAFSFHPYPNEATDPLERGYPWPNAGFANLDRLKQALWDAFDGTAQPTTLDGLKLHLDEVGWQVDTAGRVGYRGLENVPVTDEVTQAAIYGQLDPRGGVRPRRRVAQLLRLPRRRPAHRLPGGTRARRRHRAAVCRRGAGGDSRRLRRGATRLGCRRSTSSARRSQSVDKAPRSQLASRPGRTPARRSASVAASSRLAALAALPLRGRPGLRSLNVAVRGSGGDDGRVEVAVQFAAEANRTRRTLVVRRAILTTLSRA